MFTFRFFSHYVSLFVIFYFFYLFFCHCLFFCHSFALMKGYCIIFVEGNTVRKLDFTAGLLNSRAVDVGFKRVIFVDINCLDINRSTIKGGLGKSFRQAIQYHPRPPLN